MSSCRRRVLLLLLLHGAALAFGMSGCTNSDAFGVATPSGRPSGTSGGIAGDAGGGGGGFTVGPNLFGDHDGCNPASQTESSAKLTDDSMAHSGTKSCRVCSRPGFKSSRLTVEIRDTQLVGPLRLAASLYVRTTNDRRPPAKITATLHTLHMDEAPSRSLVPTDEWQELHLTLTGTPSSSGNDWVTFDVVVGTLSTNPVDAGADADAASAATDGGGDAGQEEDHCYLVDDVLLVHSQ